MSEVATVRPHLERRFVDQRVVFWHDPEGQYAADLDSLDLPGVTTVRVANDEYAIKNRLLHDEPDDKFLVYRSGQVPDRDRQLAARPGARLRSLHRRPQLARRRRTSVSPPTASTRSSRRTRSSSTRASACRA